MDRVMNHIKASDELQAFSEQVHDKYGVHVIRYHNIYTIESSGTSEESRQLCLRARDELRDLIETTGRRTRHVKMHGGTYYKGFELPGDKIPNCWKATISVDMTDSEHRGVILGKGW